MEPEEQKPEETPEPLGFSVGEEVKQNDGLV